MRDPKGDTYRRGRGLELPVAHGIAADDDEAPRDERSGHEHLGMGGWVGGWVWDGHAFVHACRVRGGSTQGGVPCDERQGRGCVGVCASERGARSCTRGGVCAVCGMCVHVSVCVCVCVEESGGLVCVCAMCALCVSA
jgi:hypothetical protein